MGNRFPSAFFIKVVQLLIITALISVNIWLLWRIRFLFDPVAVILKTVGVPVILAGGSYYLFQPFIDWLEKRKVKRGPAIFVLFVFMTLAVVFALSFILPTLKNQLVELIKSLPAIWDEILDFFNNFQIPAWLTPVILETKLNLEHITPFVIENVDGWLLGVIKNITPMIGTITNLITVIITTPIVLYYLLKEGEKFPKFLLDLIPVKYRTELSEVLYDMHEQISRYIRGQVAVSLVIGGLLYIGYLIIGMPYALTLAVTATITSVIPYLGPTIAIIPAIAIALGTSKKMLIKLIIVWVVAQTLEGKLITPQIMGKSIKVHPLTILFLIICAGKLFGVWGMVLAIPGYAVLKVVAIHLFRWLKHHSPWCQKEEKREDGRHKIAV